MSYKAQSWTKALAEYFTSCKHADVDEHKFEAAVQYKLANTELQQVAVDVLYASIRDGKPLAVIDKEHGRGRGWANRTRRKAISILRWGGCAKKFLVYIDPYDNCRMDEIYSEVWPGNFLRELVKFAGVSDPECYFGVCKGYELASKLENVVRSVSQELHPDNAYQSNLYAVVTLLYYKDRKSIQEIAVERSLSTTAVNSIIQVITNACKLNKNLRGLYDADAWNELIRLAVANRCYFKESTMPLYKVGGLKEHIDKLAELGIITCEDFLIDNSHALVEYIGQSACDYISLRVILRGRPDSKPKQDWDMHDPDPRNPFKKHTYSHKYIETPVGSVLVPYDWTDEQICKYIQENTKAETKFVG